LLWRQDRADLSFDLLLLRMHLGEGRSEDGFELGAVAFEDLPGLLLLLLRQIQPVQ